MAAYNPVDGPSGTRGFCASGKQLNGVDNITLSSYIWEYLGNQIPSEIYNTIESCTDNIQNQDETGIDCGGVCEACIIPPTTYGLSNFISAITNWLQIGNTESDVNSDGVVNSRDLGIVMSNWGE
ncbi:MAG: hypothetical protein ACD_11C00069G0001 [uncultured bacterium]|nr:MAG: hypothetical protein ACD_11C00069G0001 [uncultured bacterium]